MNIWKRLAKKILECFSVPDDMDDIQKRLDRMESKLSGQYAGLLKQLEPLQEYADQWKLEKVNLRFEVLENDRTELFRRFDQSNSSTDDRIHILEEDRTALFSRIDRMERVLRECGFFNLKSRLDARVIRLEILWYYMKPERYEQLDEEAKALLEKLYNEYDYGREEGRLFEEDPDYRKAKDDKVPYELGEEDGMWYADVDRKRIYLGENRADSEAYLKETLYWLEGETPHQYFNPAWDGIDICDGSILLDIGAAEGWFGIRHLEKCKKVYFFEYDERWLQYLRKTCAPYSDKVEIVKGYVGDQGEDIRLDDFFKNREKPTHIKMDVEGAEGAVLRGMTQMLENDEPLTIFLCTYHRQEDWDRYYELLHERFDITSSKGYYWDIQDPAPPFFRRGVMKAVKKKKYLKLQNKEGCKDD